LFNNLIAKFFQKSNFKNIQFQNLNIKTVLDKKNYLIEVISLTELSLLRFTRLKIAIVSQIEF
jgi:hypothetical protein